MALFRTKKQEFEFNQASQEIENYLIAKGYKGFSTIAETVEKATAEKRLRVITNVECKTQGHRGEPFNLEVLYSDGMWCIGAELFNDSIRLQKAMTYLACRELEVPLDLIRKLIQDDTLIPVV